jgi:type IV secretion system protein VirB10
MTAGNHESVNPDGSGQKYPPSPLSMDMGDMNGKNAGAKNTKARRTSGQKILMFALIVTATVFGFVMMAANSARTVRERQADEKGRKPLMSDPTALENDLLAAAETLKYRQTKAPIETPLAPENRIAVVRPPVERRAEPRILSVPVTDEEREAARKYRDMRLNALLSKSGIDGFQEISKADGVGEKGNSFSQAQLLNALAGAGGNNAGAGAALIQETQNAQDVNANDPNGYRHKLGFLTQGGAGRTPQGYSANTRNAPLAPMELKAGSVIPGLLITGINSDLPGTVVGQVSENVWDTATGRFLLIPQGTRIVGVYDSRITQGQKRISVVWNRLIYPDGSSLNIAGSPGTDVGGYSGIKGRVDNHYGQLLTAVLFSSVFATLADVAAGDTPDNDKKSAKDVLLETTGVTIANVGARLAERALDIQPTIVVKPGRRFNVMVQQDVVFMQAWKIPASN